MTPTETKICPHPLTEANCESGSWREIAGVRTFIPMAHVCENCKIHACDDCAESWPGVCVCCGGGICGDCAATARSRRISEPIALGAPYRTRTEFLCAKCAESQDAAISALNDTVYYQIRSRLDQAQKRIADVASDLEQSLIRIRTEYYGKYPEQCGALDATATNAAIVSRMIATSMKDDKTVCEFGGTDVWLSDIIYDLEEAISEAKRAL